MATTAGQHSARPVVSFAPPPATSNLPTQSASGWHNLTAWAVNRTRSVPFLHELVGAGPRMLKRFGVLMALTEAADGSNQLYESATTRAGFFEPIVTDPNIINVLHPKPLELSVNAASSTPAAASDQSLSTASRLALDGPRGLGSVFGYAVSKWALACVAMAILLNRTHVFAATRRRLRLGWDIRLLLRLPPILLLSFQVYWLLQSIQCQTSSDFARLRWGDPEKNSALVFAYPSAILNRLTSTLLFGATDEQSCIRVGMTPSNDSSASLSLRGSLSLLWPLFGTFCLSHFLETVSCAIQGRPTAAETGMTLFEQSLAFAEADAAIWHQLNWKSLSASQQAASSTSMGPGNANALTRSLLMKRVNTAPEVLLVALLSTLTHITSHVLGVFDLQAKYRLLNTGFWGICFMASIVWSISLFDLETASAQGLMRFPTVCIIGFVPHVLVVIGIILCASIYGLALLLSTLALPPDQVPSNLTWRQRLSHARSNMQANLTFADIRVTRDMDFYTALLKVGFAAISLASEAVYLHEDRGVFLRSHTWLEQARFREMEELQRQSVGIGRSNTRLDQVGTIGLIPIQGETLTASSGYARERAAQQVPKGFREQRLRVGTGATERSSRWLMAFEFLLSIGKLARRVAILSLVGLLSTLRIRSRPAWLFRRGKSADGERKSMDIQARPHSSQQFSECGQDVKIPHIDDIDVETVFRQAGRQKDEQSLDKELYQYWARGEWWGSKDLSGDFEPQEKDWDTTSLISTAASDLGDMHQGNDDVWESEDDGQRTPQATAHSPSPTENSLIDTPLQAAELARLLQPTTRREREEAQMLAAHLQSEKIMTRGDFWKNEHLRRLRILTTSRPAMQDAYTADQSAGANKKFGPDEEERLLEQFLLSRRSTSRHNGSADTGRLRLGPDHSVDSSEDRPCVVCQSSQRTIIVWPCRCLCLCDDCRVSLAMNSFDKCVCCRRDVISFSRIFVP